MVARDDVARRSARHSKATQKGIPGGLLSGMLFQYPGLMMMAPRARARRRSSSTRRTGRGGLTAAEVGLGARWSAPSPAGLAKGQCKDEVTSVLCLTSGVVAYYYTSNWIFALLIVIGGLTTRRRRDDVRPPDKAEVNRTPARTSSARAIAD